MKRSLLDYIQYYTKLDERTIKYYLDLLDQRIISKEFFKYYVNEHSLLNFEKWLTDKDLIIQIQNGYLVLPPISALITGLVKLRDSLKSFNKAYLDAFNESIQSLKKDLLSIDIASGDEINIITAYRDLFEKAITGLKNHTKSIQDVLNYYNAVLKRISLTLNELSTMMSKFNGRILSVEDKIGELEGLIKEKRDLISSEIKRLDEVLHGIESDVINFVNEFKNTAESSTSSIMKLVQEQIDLINKLKEDFSRSAKILIDKKDEFEKSLDEVSQTLLEKREEIKAILKEIKSNVDDIIHSEVNDSLKTMKDTLEMMSSETLRIFNDNLQKITKDITDISEGFLREINNVSEKLRKNGDELLLIQKEVIQRIKEDINSFIESNSENLDKVEENVLERVNEIVNVSESLIKQIRNDFAVIDELSSKQANYLSQFIALQVSNLEVEKEHFIVNLRTLLSKDKRENTGLDMIFSRLKGAIGRLEDLYNLKVRQIYKSLNDLKKEGEEKLSRISTSTIMKDIETVIGYFSNSLIRIERILELIESLSNKLDSRASKFTEIPIETGLEELNKLLNGLSEENKSEVIKLFNKQRSLYLSALKSFRKEAKKDLEQVIREIKSELDTLRSLEENARASVSGFSDELKKSILEAYETLINEYVNLLYESTKESIIQMIYDGEKILDSEREKMSDAYSSIIDSKEKIMGELVKFIKMYHERVISALSDLGKELQGFTAKEFAELRDAVISRINKSIDQYRVEINKLSNDLESLIKPIRNYLSNLSLETNQFIDRRVSEFNEEVKKYVGEIKEITSKYENNMTLLKKNMLAEINNVLEQIKELKKIDIENHIRIFNKTMENINKSLSTSISNTVDAASSLIDTSINEASNLINQEYSQLINNTTSELSKLINDTIFLFENHLTEANRIREEIDDVKSKCLDNTNKLVNELNSINKNIDYVSKEITASYNELTAFNQEVVERLKELLSSYQEVLGMLSGYKEEMNSSKKDLESEIKRLSKRIDEFNNEIMGLESNKEKVIGVLNTYVDAVTRPIQYLKTTLNNFERYYSRKIKKKESDISNEILGLIDLGNSLISLIKGKWRDRELIGEILYGKNIVSESIKSMLTSDSSNVNIIVPSEIVRNILDIINGNNKRARTVLYTNNTDILRESKISKNLKIERIKEDIPYLVIVSNGERAIICDKNLNYAIELVNDELIREILFTWIKSKYAKKIKFRI